MNLSLFQSEIIKTIYQFCDPIDILNCSKVCINFYRIYMRTFFNKQPSNYKHFHSFYNQNLIRYTSKRNINDDEIITIYDAVSKLDDVAEIRENIEESLIQYKINTMFTPVFVQNKINTLVQHTGGIPIENSLSRCWYAGWKNTKFILGILCFLLLVWIFGTVSIYMAYPENAGQKWLHNTKTYNFYWHCGYTDDYFKPDVCTWYNDWGVGSYCYAPRGPCRDAEFNEWIDVIIKTTKCSVDDMIRLANRSQTLELWEETIPICKNMKNEYLCCMFAYNRFARKGVAAVIGDPNIIQQLAISSWESGLISYIVILGIIVSLGIAYYFYFNCL